MGSRLVVLIEEVVEIATVAGGTIIEGNGDVVVRCVDNVRLGDTLCDGPEQVAGSKPALLA